MNSTFLLLLFTLLSLQLPAQRTQVTGLTCEYKENPLGITSPAPGLNWQLSTIPGDSDNRNVIQSAYRILVADDPVLLQKNIGDIWDSQKVLSGQSLQVLFKGNRLQPTKLYYWKVMVWDKKGNGSAWSKPANWQMGLPEPSDWLRARWIADDALPDSLLLLPGFPPADEKVRAHSKEVLPLVRKLFTVHKKVQRATVYICGLGQFEIHLNGKKLGDHFLDPGWTGYDKHTLYVSFDVTDSLRHGDNAIGVMLGNGFYFIPEERYHKLSVAFGYPKMICRLAIQYADVTTEDIVSDSSWKTAASPVTFSSIYGGEDYDARLEQAGWDEPFFDDKTWKPALPVTGPPELAPQLEEPLKIFEHFFPQKITRPKPGIWVYDLGQNASGIPRIEVTGKKGSVIKITPAELTTEEGLATQEAIGKPVYFTYTLKGDEKETWQPQFMYYGFRYLQIEGAVPAGDQNPDELPVINNLQGLHTRNAALRTGEFFCSDTLFDKIFSLIDWAIQSNTASIFTDCPHREKLGWLEEAHLVGPSIRYNYDISTLIRKVVRDMMYAQTPEGLIPDIAPEFTEFEGGFRDSPEWGSSAIILPWYAWQWYGDRRI
jgi:alpha-L-rhamnosidase